MATVFSIPVDSPEYDTCYKKRGTCLVINNKTFDRSNLSERAGSEKDVDQLTTCFNNLGFNVKPVLDKKCSEIMSALRLASKDEDNFFSDCFLCIVMTHGNLEHLSAYDREYEVTRLFDYFTGDLCPSLRGKPKIFFIQACRGDKTDPGALVGYKDTAKITYFKIPITSDFLVVYSSYPDYNAHRHPEQGSWFIQSLTSVFNQHAEQMDIMSMAVDISRKVAFEFESKNSGSKQMPCLVSTLTRKLFFYPKPDSSTHESGRRTLSVNE